MEAKRKSSHDPHSFSTTSTPTIPNYLPRSGATAGSSRDHFVRVVNPTPSNHSLEGNASSSANERHSRHSLTSHSTSKMMKASVRKYSGIEGRQRELEKLLELSHASKGSITV